MSIDLLRKDFMEMIELEKRAKHFYEHYIDQIDDKELKNELISIRDEENVHIKIVEKLIEYVS